MPRRKSSSIISEVLASAESLRNSISAVPSEVQDRIRDLALVIVNKPAKKRGRPPGRKRGRPPGRKKRVRPRKRAKALAKVSQPTQT